MKLRNPLKQKPWAGTRLAGVVLAGVAALAVGTMGYRYGYEPKLTEGTTTNCAAAEKKGFRNPDYFDGNTIAQWIMQGISAVAPGEMARTYVQAEYPGWPPELVCGALYHTL